MKTPDQFADTNFDIMPETFAIPVKMDPPQTFAIPMSWEILPRHVTHE